MGRPGGEPGEEYLRHLHTDFVLYNDPRRLPSADRPATKDVNSNYTKVTRSNSRLSQTLKKLLPRRKSSKVQPQPSIGSEVNLTGIYNNNKYIIKVNSEPAKTEGEAPGWAHREEVVRAARPVARNKSFLLGAAGNKVKRSASVLPGLLGRRAEPRPVVEVAPVPWQPQERPKEPRNTSR